MTADEPFSEPVEVPITDVFDLHTIAPRDARVAIEAYLEAAHDRGFRYVRIEGANHWPQLTAPEKLNPLLLQLLH